MKNLRIHCLQHVAFEGIGCIANWATQNGHTLTHTRFYADEALPEVSSFDCLIVMGGPMSVHDEAAHEWLKAEKAFIKKTINEGKKLIGICLGAQLIAAAMDASVYANAEKEIGWLPIQFSNDALALFPFLPASQIVFHWHGDTFDLPANAVLLAESDGCKNQAYIIGQQVLGLQFHIEVTEESLQQMLHHGASELLEANYIQSADAIKGQQHLIPQNNQILLQMFDYLLTM